MTKRKEGAVMGRPPWEPNEEQRQLVAHCTAIGYTQEQIAAVLEVDADTLAKHCRRELDTGGLVVNAKIGGKLYQKAMTGDVAALIWWSKCRMGWKDTTRLEFDMDPADALKQARLKRDER